MGECGPLSEEDRDYLEKEYPGAWDFRDNRYLIIRNFCVPEGYKSEGKVELMVIVPSNYPCVLFDMFYFRPDIQREDGQTIAALASENHMGKDWQRWSRHYTQPPRDPSFRAHLQWLQSILMTEISQ